MQSRMSNTMFRLMSLEFKLKAMLSNPAALLEEAGVGAGMTVVDFGCGPGRYTIPAARLVGATGRVYAADVHPLALDGVARAARRRGLANVETLATEAALAIPDASVDVVLLYDTLHDVERRDEVIQELLRVLKEGGVLSYRDHTLDVDSAFRSMIAAGQLRPLEGGGQATRLRRTEPAEREPTPSAVEP